jgi:hypothetical protein
MQGPDDPYNLFALPGHTTQGYTTPGHSDSGPYDLHQLAVDNDWVTPLPTEQRRISSTPASPLPTSRTEHVAMPQQFEPQQAIQFASNPAPFFQQREICSRHAVSYALTLPAETHTLLEQQHHVATHPAQGFQQGKMFFTAAFCN